MSGRRSGPGLPRRVRRRLERRWRRALAGIVLLYALGHAPGVPAARIDVGAGGCTLVDAITAANIDQPTGGCSAGNGADTITLPAGSTQALTQVDNSTFGYSGLPVVTSPIVIGGNGSTITRAPDATAEFRILAIAAEGNLTLQETTVTGGGGTSGIPGGGILNCGTLSLTDSTVAGNVAGEGGGLRNSGSLTLVNSSVSTNVAYGVGGGVHNTGSAALVNSTVSGNSGSSGGGIHNSGSLLLTNSTVSGNTAYYYDSVYGSYGSGGGVRNEGTMVVSQSTITANSAVSRGGGVYNALSGTLTLVQTLVSGNGPSSAQGREVGNFTAARVYAGAFNLFGRRGASGLEGFTEGASDIVPSGSLSTILDPTLGDNGGPTKTHALIAGSPAIDGVPAAACASASDQRGITRPQDGDGDTQAGCDVGAFEQELRPPAPPPPDASPVDRNPRVRCGTKRCKVAVQCEALPGSVGSCDIQVQIFVRRLKGVRALNADPSLPGLRGRGALRALTPFSPGAATAQRRIRFATGVAGIFPGTSANVSLRLTKNGRRIVRTSSRKRLRGVMEIRDSAGNIESLRVRIRLRR